MKQSVEVSSSVVEVVTVSDETAELLSLSEALAGQWRPPQATSKVRCEGGSGAPQVTYKSKRAFDCALSACLLVVICPVLLLCACLIKMESSGPVLFRQRRIGLGGKEFTIFKLRTMVKNGNAMLEQHLSDNPAAAAEWSADHKLRNDPRITRVGGIMRRFSLDEVPQLVNVLKGDMSLIGPRPIVEAEVGYYKELFKTYCAVRPGLTGLWQVSGRSDTGYGLRVTLDQQYVDTCSMRVDASILTRTVRAVLDSSGAY